MNSSELAWRTVREFEQVVAEYAGSKYAVAVDTCTAALFLACKHLNVNKVILPQHTYCSVPCSVIHAGGSVEFQNIDWKGLYQLDPYPIVDGACRFRRGMYVKGTLHCLSFQYRKHLPIGRGGMVLTDSDVSASWLKLARFSGRHEVPLLEDIPEFVGWSCYMEPERAARGLTLMSNVKDMNEDLVFQYPNLQSFGLYE